MVSEIDFVAARVYAVPLCIRFRGITEELAAVRRQVDVRIAADESIRRAEDPMRAAVSGAADVAVIKCTPLGGVRRALAVAEAAGLPCVVSSARAPDATGSRCGPARGLHAARRAPGSLVA